MSGVAVWPPVDAELAGRWRQPGRTFVEVLRHRASEHGDELLYGFLDPDARLTESLSYRSLLRRATGLARLLIDEGLSGKSALLAYPHGPEFIVGFFAALIAGVVPAPVKLPRRREEAAVLARIASDAGASAVLVADRRRQAIEQRFAAEPALAGLLVLSERPDEQDGAADVRVRVSADDVALLQYTSGSTSDPKGVQVTHASLIANSEAIRLGSANDRTSISLSWLPMYHDMGLIGGVLQPLYTGFPDYFINPTAVLQQPSRWLAAISRWRVTSSGGPNFGYEMCLRRPPGEDSGPLDLSSWRVAYNGSEPVSAATIDSFCARFAAAGFSPRAFYPCYGLAEATLMVTGGTPDDDVRTMIVDGDELARGVVVAAAEGPSARRLVGCGRPGLGVELAVVDPKLERPVGPGHVGEIWVAGPGVASGYRNRPLHSRRTFGARLADRPGTAFLRTGDLGFVADGQLYVVGRLHDMIVLRGRNLYPEDVESTVLAACARWEATGCAVFAADDAAALGRGQGIVVALELPRRADDALQHDMAERVRERVANVHGVTVSGFVAIERGLLPRTSSGKLRRAECARQHRMGTLGSPSRPDMATNSAAPGVVR